MVKMEGHIGSPSPVGLVIIEHSKGLKRGGDKGCHLTTFSWCESKIKIIFAKILNETQDLQRYSKISSSSMLLKHETYVLIHVMIVICCIIKWNFPEIKVIFKYFDHFFSLKKSPKPFWNYYFKNRTSDEQNQIISYLYQRPLKELTKFELLQVCKFLQSNRRH